MDEARKARAIGFNHVALEVGDIEEALAFYGRLFEFKLRGKTGTSAFIDLGDQFLALQKGRTQPADEGRHFGLVVDDKDAVRKARRRVSNRCPDRSSTFSTRGATA
jgi:lactoylglutathione lyase